MLKHIDIVKSFGVKPVVAINRFADDHDGDIREIEMIAREAGVRSAVATHVVDGGDGARVLAQAVVDASDEETDFRFTYELEEIARSEARCGGSPGIRSRWYRNCPAAASQLRSTARPATARCRC
ncbi:MAG: formate--tetrahydrofolate ligase [Thermomicrobiales bacterium]